MQPYHATTFNAHYYSCEVYPVSETLIYTQNEATDYHPLCISKSFSLSSTLFVKIKYDVCYV